MEKTLSRRSYLGKCDDLIEGSMIKQKRNESIDRKSHENSISSKLKSSISNIYKNSTKNVV